MTAGRYTGQKVCISHPGPPLGKSKNEGDLSVPSQPFPGEEGVGASHGGKLPLLVAAVTPRVCTALLQPVLVFTVTVLGQRGRDPF